MSLPRRKPELAELVSTLPARGGESEDERSGSREVLIAPDEEVTRAIKRVTRDHRDLLIALAK